MERNRRTSRNEKNRPNTQLKKEKTETNINKKRSNKLTDCFKETKTKEKNKKEKNKIREERIIYDVNSIENKSDEITYENLEYKAMKNLELKIKKAETRRNKRRRVKAKKKKKHNFFTNLLIFICLLTMLGSGAYIVKYLIDTKKAQNAVSEIGKILDKKIDENKNNKDEEQKLDLSEFLKINDESKFILKYDGLDIKNVVVQTSNNDFYIYNDIYKNPSMSGWLFADYRNKADGTDKNLIVYGHNMRDGKTMFSPMAKFNNYNNLNNLKDEDKVIEIMTENSKEKYKIFSVYEDHDQNIDLRIPYTDIDLKNYSKQMLARSIYNFNEDISGIDKMLTLATCGRTNDYRIIVHAYRIK